MVDDPPPRRADHRGRVRARVAAAGPGGDTHEPRGGEIGILGAGTAAASAAVASAHLVVIVPARRKPVNRVGRTAYIGIGVEERRGKTRVVCRHIKLVIGRTGDGVPRAVKLVAPAITGALVVGVLGIVNTDVGELKVPGI